MINNVGQTIHNEKLNGTRQARDIFELKKLPQG
jgi:hypothetical protein